MSTLVGKRKQNKNKLLQASREELGTLLSSLSLESKKLRLVHGLRKLKQTSLIKKNRRTIATVRTILRIKYHVR